MDAEKVKEYNSKQKLIDQIEDHFRQYKIEEDRHFDTSMSFIRMSALLHSMPDIVSITKDLVTLTQSLIKTKLLLKMEQLKKEQENL